MSIETSLITKKSLQAAKSPEARSKAILEFADALHNIIESKAPPSLLPFRLERTGARIPVILVRNRLVDSWRGVKVPDCSSENFILALDWKPTKKQERWLTETFKEIAPGFNLTLEIGACKDIVAQGTSGASLG